MIITNISEVNSFYVYIFLDNENNILYIGKTFQLRQRMRQHFTEETVKLESWKSLVNKENIILLFCQNASDLDIYETYFINKYNPTYNKEKVFNAIPTFELPYIEPIIYNFKFKNIIGNGTFKDKCIEYLNNPETRSIINTQYPLIAEAYIKLGAERMKALSYNKHKLINELKLNRLDIKDCIKQEVVRLFEINNVYTASEIKDTLTDIYNRLMLTKKAKATDLEDYFVYKTTSKRIGTDVIKVFKILNIKNS